MSFATPMMLFGLFALVIPLWIHLRRVKRHVVDFPAIELLFKVHKKHRSQLRLRNLLLLLLRMAVIVFVVFAASRPGITVERPGGIRAGMPLALVIVVDDSLSMRFRGADGESTFKKAKALAQVELARLRPGDGAAVILTGRPARPVFDEVVFDVERVRVTVQELQPSYRTGDLKKALGLAFELLRDNSLPQREVVVISDLSDQSWDGSDAPWAAETQIGLRILNPAPHLVRHNSAVEWVRVSPSPDGASKEVVIEAQLVNHSSQTKKDTSVVLEVDGVEMARGQMRIAANGRATKRFHHQFEKEGIYRGSVRIDDDGLLEDNLRHFSVMVRQSISALVIDGDYRPGSYRDEAFYLHRALETPLPGEVPIRSIVIDADTASSAPLTGNDVVFVVGMPGIEGALASRLVDYVRGGGGLFVSPGPDGAGLTQLESILPARIRSIKQASPKNRFFRVLTVNRAHPVFLPFGGKPSGLEGTRVWTHLLVEPEPSIKRTTLIELENGLPLLMERKVDGGRVMLLTTTIDRDWTDIPIRPGYLPLMQRAARHLAGRLDDRKVKRILVGEPIAVEVSQGMQRLIVRRPDQRDVTYSARELSERTFVRFTETELPGHYRIWAEIPDFGGLKELFSAEFVVEVSPTESDLTQILAPAEGDPTTRFVPVKGRLPIWPYLLFVTMVWLLLETWLSSWGLKRSHIRPIGFEKIPRRRFPH